MGSIASHRLLTNYLLPGPVTLLFGLQPDLYYHFSTIWKLTETRDVSSRHAPFSFERTAFQVTCLSPLYFMLSSHPLVVVSELRHQWKIVGLGIDGIIYRNVGRPHNVLLIHVIETFAQSYFSCAVSSSELKSSANPAASSTLCPGSSPMSWLRRAKTSPCLLNPSIIMHLGGLYYPICCLILS